MLLSLHFSKYKQREESCCSSGHCSATHHIDHNHACKKEHIDFINKIKVDNLKV